MKNFLPKLRICALASCAVQMAACTSTGYNDNPSQQMTNATVGCPAATDFFAVYFSLHVQPAVENQDERITRERFRSYCNEIPTPGKVFLTADLVGGELRKIPIGIRIVEDAGDDESPNGSFKDAHILSEIAPKTYPNGVIESSFHVNDKGRYAIYLTRGGEYAVSEEDELKIPLDVGVGSGAERQATRVLILFGIASGLAPLGHKAFRYLRRRKWP